MNKKIFLVFFFAFVIRLIAINQSLWLDEAVTAKVVMSYSYTEIINKFSPTDFHPPLYYLFMKTWTNIFGYSELALRFPSIIFSLLTGYVVYKIASLLHGSIAGKWAATFFLFNPLIVYYSQEARMYMMATFFLTVSLFFFLRLSSSNLIGGSRKLDSRLRGNDKNSLFFGLFISLAFITFYGSIFLIIPMLLYLLFKKKYTFFILNTLYFTLAALVISPLLYQQIINSKIALASVTNWSATLGKANIKNLLLIPIKFSIGRISFYPKYIYWFISGVWTGSILYQISKIKNQNDKLKLKNTHLFYYLLIFPLILGFIVSFFIPMLQYFRFLYLIPIASLLLSFGLLSQPSSNLRGQILVGGFLIFTLVYLLNPAFHREDWKGLIKDLPKNRPVYMIMSSSDPIRYYSNNLNIKDLSGQPVEKDINVIPYTSDIHGLDYKSLLSNKGYQLKKEKSFRELTYEQWSLK